MRRTARSMMFNSFAEFEQEYPALGQLLCRDDNEFLDAMRRRIVDGLHLSQGQIDAMRKFLGPGTESGPPCVGKLVSFRATLPGTRRIDKGRTFYHWTRPEREWSGLLCVTSPAREAELDAAVGAVGGRSISLAVNGRVLSRRAIGAGWHLVIRGGWSGAVGGKTEPEAKPPREPSEPMGREELAKSEGDDDWFGAMKG